MSNPTGSEARPPERPTPVLTDAQKDGLACIRCGLIFADWEPGPGFDLASALTVPAGLWNGVQLFRCGECPEPVTAGHLEAPAGMREASEIDELIERAAECAGQAFALLRGERAGQMARQYMRQVLADAATGCELDPGLVGQTLSAIARGGRTPDAHVAAAILPIADGIAQIMTRRLGEEAGQTVRQLVITVLMRVAAGEAGAGPAEVEAFEAIRRGDLTKARALLARSCRVCLTEHSGALCPSCGWW